MLARQTLLVMSIAVLTIFTHLGSSKLWDRDEPRNARCAWEMLKRGDWVVPTFNDELRTHKPILLYWLTMVSYSAFGVSEFAARFSSAALAVSTVLLTYFIGRRLFDPQAAFWSAIVLTSTLMFNVAARAATPDSTLIFCGTLALCIYVYSVPRRQWSSASSSSASSSSASSSSASSSSFDIRSMTFAAGIYGAMGLAVLAKGPVGLVLPTAVIGMFLLIARLPVRTPKDTPPSYVDRLTGMIRPFSPKHFLNTCWKMRPVTAILAAAVVAVPWYYLVGVKTDGAWLRGFFLDHNVGRAMTPMEGHNGSVLFYPAALLVGFFPWSVLAVPVGLWVRGKLRESQWHFPVTFLLCWIGVYIGAFSLAQTKLPSYVTPIYPAIALLCGGYLTGWLQSSRETHSSTLWPQISMLCLAVVGGVIAVVLPIVAHLFLPGEEWLGIAGAIPLLGGIIAWLALRRRQQALAARAFATTAICLVITLFAFIAPRVSEHQRIDQLLKLADDPASSPSLASFGAHEPSWVFYAGQPIQFFRRGQQTDVVEYLSSERSGYLITTQQAYDQLLPHLPSSVSVVDSVPYFLEDERLVLLTRATLVSRSDTDSAPAR